MAINPKAVEIFQFVKAHQQSCTITLRATTLVQLTWLFECLPKPCLWMHKLSLRAHCSNFSSCKHRPQYKNRMHSFQFKLCCPAELNTKSQFLSTWRCFSNSIRTLPHWGGSAGLELRKNCSSTVKTDLYDCCDQGEPQGIQNERIHYCTLFRTSRSSWWVHTLIYFILMTCNLLHPVALDNFSFHYTKKNSLRQLEEIVFNGR